MTQLELTNDERTALNASGLPLRLVDSQSNQTYVIISEDLYQRLSLVLDADPLSPLERMTVLRHAWQRAGWDDPEMNEYETLLPSRKP